MKLLRLLAAVGMATCMAAASALMAYQPAEAAANCQPSIQVVTFRGSGESKVDDQALSNGWSGPTLQRIISKARNITFNDGTSFRNIQIVGIPYPAVPASEYFDKKQDLLQSVEYGRLLGINALKKAKQNCAQTRFVLLGYSQGVVVAREVAKSVPADWIVSVFGMGDPAQKPNSRGLRSDGKSGNGIYRALVGTSVDNFLNTSIGYISYCHLADPICDFSISKGLTGAATHGSYGKDAGELAEMALTLAGLSHTPRPIPPPTGVGGARASLAQGPAAPSGFRYAISLSGYPARSTISITCYDSASPNGFYTFILTSDSSGAASTAAYCYSIDGPDHWVRAGGIESNHASWGATAPPPAPATWAETTGGAANTWTNYANAGGSQGPTIAANTTVRIACKLSGFKVADGNTWWYRVASEPWSNKYYVSADAFYNNGRTSGSLVGTPFVDTSVGNC